MSSVAGLKALVDIVQVVGARVALKKLGRGLVGLCPFHSEESPSFFVRPEAQRYHCFGCGADGDVISFVQQIDGVPFAEALKRIGGDGSRCEDVTRRNAQRRVLQLEVDEDLKRRRAWAAQRIDVLLHKSTEAGRSPYLIRKRVADESEESLRFLGSTLLITAQQRGALVGGQLIHADGSKRFLTGTPMHGSFHVFGRMSPRGLIVVCEGVATGLSLRAALKWRRPVVIAFHCGNLAAVVTFLRERYPSAPLLVCADDDWGFKKPLSTAENPGRVFAWRACRAVDNAHLLLPTWPLGVVRSPNDTDFNDLHCAAGIDVVKHQLSLPLSVLEMDL